MRLSIVGGVGRWLQGGEQERGSGEEEQEREEKEAELEASHLCPRRDGEDNWRDSI